MNMTIDELRQEILNSFRETQLTRMSEEEIEYIYEDATEAELNDMLLTLKEGYNYE